MDWSLLRQKAKNCRPREELPPKRWYVAILEVDKSPDATLVEQDFLWIKVHGKITMEKLQETYSARHTVDDVELKFEKEVAPSTIVKEPNLYRDDLIVLQAVKRDNHFPPHQVNHQPATQMPSATAVGIPPPHSLQAAPQVSPATAVEIPPPYSLHAAPQMPPATTVGNPPPYSLQEPATAVGMPLSYSLPTPLVNQAVTDTPPRSLRLNEDTSTLTTRLQATPHTQVDGSCDVAPAPRTPISTVRRIPRLTPLANFPVPPSEQSRSPYTSEPLGNGSLFVSPGERESPSLQGRSPTPTPMPMTAATTGESQPPEPESQIPSLDPSEIFSNDSSGGMEQGPPSLGHIQQVIDGNDVSLLEAGVRQGIRALDAIKGAFSSYPSNDEARAWIDSIDKLKQQAKLSRTVVGVVGNTGAGKSSVINAMLDEERLVPTNCMRACTAVVTELSWNDSDDPSSKYRAEIEFISRAEWEKEVTILHKEFLNEDGQAARETSDPNSDAGIAWAKFHAVYPKKTKEMLADSTVSQLVDDSSIRRILGTTIRINERTAQPFYKKLQQYVDSKEKATGKKDKREEKKKKAPVEMEFWPLIKVVKIYTKSPALSTGAVIVDLPGVHDSNAARAAVAQGYMKQCTGLWIVAPITRAVDDKAAKTLLGDTFKRQLKYDGGFSNVTFICSKTDDISRTEAMDSLGLEEQMSSLEDDERKMEKEVRSLQEKIVELAESKKVYNEAYDSIEDDIERWERLKDDLNEGKSVYAPDQAKRKRTRSASPKRSKKRRKEEDDSDDDFVVSDEESEAQSDDSGSESDPDSDAGTQASRQPLTEEEINAKLDELKESKKNARRQRAELELQIKDLRPQVQETKSRLAEVRAEMDAICIAGRNEYSRGAIQLDFAAGIKEIDQENAAEEDEENFNPDEDIRDYEQVARSLPVFCVSSRAYQKLSGRLVKDSNVPGFKTLEETEIPQLQAHCKKLTEANRIHTCKAFLLDLKRQLNTFSLWACDDGDGLKLTDDQKRSQVQHLNRRLTELEQGLEKAVESCIKRVKKDIEDQIFEKYPEVIEEAVRAAPITASQWGAPKDAGGLLWATYKATVRRDGVYKGAAGLRDFNAELMEPITKKLATSWERTFQNRLPKAFEVYIKDSNAILRHFHQMVEDRCRQTGVGLATLSMLKSQVYTNEDLFNNFYNVLLAAMTDLQRDANRDFTPVIVTVMQTAYTLCTEEKGKGSFMRMKNHMVNHVDRVRHHMFKDAIFTVRAHLDKMCKELQKQMEDKADEIYASMRHDYVKALGGGQVSTTVLSREDRAMRAQLKPLLLEVDQKFKAVLEGMIEEEIGQPRSKMEENSEHGEEGAEQEEADKMNVDAEPLAANDDIVKAEVLQDQRGLPSPVEERDEEQLQLEMQQDNSGTEF